MNLSPSPVRPGLPRLLRGFKRAVGGAFHFPAAIWRAVNILLAALSGGD
jgi:hypothetical protein